MSLSINTLRLLSTSARRRRVPLVEFWRRSALLVLVLMRVLVELRATADALIKVTPAVNETKVSVIPNPEWSEERWWRLGLLKAANSHRGQRWQASPDISTVNRHLKLDISRYTYLLKYV